MGSFEKSDGLVRTKQLWILALGAVLLGGFAPVVVAFVAAVTGGHYVAAQDMKMEDLSENLPNIDLIYEATGAAGPAFKLLGELGTNGVFILTGVPGKRGPVPIETDVLMRNLVLRNQILYGTVNAGPDAFKAAVEDLTEFSKRWPAVVPKLITQRFAPEKFADVLLGKSFGIKNVIQFSA